MQLRQGATHYLAFRGSASGLTRASFTFHLIENGTDRADIPVDVREVRARTYVASFTNDADSESQWSLLVFEAASPSTLAGQGDWLVKSSATDANVQFIKSNI
jgi:hypothetical protein